MISSSRPAVLGVIPARLASTRLPRKVLLPIAGKPMLAWVYEAARASSTLDEVIVATDSEEVAQLCRRHDWPVRMTSPDLPSGTDRVHAVAREIPADIYINIQGDEPLLRPEHIDAVLRPMLVPRPSAAEVLVSTVMTPCTPENFANPNAVKVVTNREGRALYFSRSTIPFDRDAWLGQPSTAPAYWKHLGLYAYRRSALDRFPLLPPSQLEAAERLEQLRFLENGIDLWVEPVPFDTIGVDTEDDRRTVEALLLAR